MGTSSLKDKSLKTLKRALTLLPLLFKKTIRLFRKRDLVIIAFFTILGIGGVFAAGAITLTQSDTQGAGYAAVTSCDPNVTINKNISFDLTLNRYVISTISITDIDQRYGAGCGNLIMELALPMNGDVTYASWTIPSSTITNGVFTYGANNSTGITYRAYTPLTPIDVQYSFEKAAIAVRPSTRAITNGPVYDLLKDNGFTTAGQSNSSTTLTFALSLSCGTLTVDTTQPGVTTALSNLAAPTGYVTNNATSTGVNGATSAAYLGFRGSIANINTVLPWISYSWISSCTTTTPTFQGAIWDAQDATNPVAWNFTDNGHYYQYVNTNNTWDGAYQAITGQSANYPNALPATRASATCNYSVFNLCGYFATVQTGPENAFITTKTGGSAAWLGGIDRGTEGSNKAFKWADPKAPEFDKIFSTYTKTGGAGWGVGTNIASSYTVNGTTYFYENWNNGEPNNYGAGETALQILAGGAGNWNDLPENSSSLPYVVEYGGISGETAIAAGSRTSAIVWHY